MNKEEFNALIIEEQVEYINTQLALVSLNRIATAIGISESTIRDRFKSKGYVRQGKSFIKLGTIEPKKENKKSKTPKKNITNTIDTKAQEHIQSNKNTNVLEKRVESLEKELEGIKTILNNTVNTTNTSKSKGFKKYTGTTVSRNYRINEEVQQEFKKYCKANTEYSVTDLISLALEEFMEKHK